MGALRTLYWIVWIGGGLLAIVMIAPFFVAVLFSASMLTVPPLALDAALVIGLYGGTMALGLGSTVTSALWLRQRHFGRAWLAALLTYVAFALQVIVSIA